MVPSPWSRPVGRSRTCTEVSVNRPVAWWPTLRGNCLPARQDRVSAPRLRTLEAEPCEPISRQGHLQDVAGFLKSHDLVRGGGDQLIEDRLDAIEFELFLLVLQDQRQVLISVAVGL